MKTKIVIGLFVLSFNLCIGQSYIPILGNTNEWYVHMQGVGGSETTKYSIITDTIFNSIEYKVYRGDMIMDYTQNYVREDSINERVYLRYSIDSIQTYIDTSEILLYDFSMNVGDSINYKRQTDSIWCYVDSIVLVSTNAGYRNKYYLHYYDPLEYYTMNIEWIEGVGSLIEFNYPYVTDYFSLNSLNCFFRNGIKIYQSDFSASLGDCNIETSINSYTNQIEIQLYPNPAQENITIKATQNINQIEVIDYSGRIIRTITDINEPETIINISGLKQGFYFVKCKINNKVFTEKIMIQQANY